MDDPLKGFAFVGYTLDVDALSAVGRFRDRYGCWPALIIGPPQHYEAITGDTLAGILRLGVAVTPHERAKGMWYTGPIPEEVNDDEQGHVHGD